MPITHASMQRKNSSPNPISRSSYHLYASAISSSASGVNTTESTMLFSCSGFHLFPSPAQLRIFGKPFFASPQFVTHGARHRRIVVVTDAVPQVFNKLKLLSAAELEYLVECSFHGTENTLAGISSQESASQKRIVLARSVAYSQKIGVQIMRRLSRILGVSGMSSVRTKGRGVHLSTIIVTLILAGACVWVNLRQYLGPAMVFVAGVEPTEGSDLGGKNGTVTSPWRYGFPWYAYEAYDPLYSKWRAGQILLNLAFCSSFVLLAGVFTEKMLRSQSPVRDKLSTITWQLAFVACAVLFFVNVTHPWSYGDGFHLNFGWPSIFYDPNILPIAFLGDIFIALLIVSGTMAVSECAVRHGVKIKFQFHLGTAVILMLLAGLFVGYNCPMYSKYEIGYSEGESGYSYGWPLALIHVYGEWRGSTLTDSWYMDWTGVISNLVFLFATLFLIAFVFEYFIYKSWRGADSSDPSNFIS